MQKLARIQHGGKTHTIALFEDLQPDELNNLLTTVFNIEGQVLGFLDQVSTFILYKRCFQYSAYVQQIF